MSAEAAVGAAATGEGQADLQAVRVPGLTRDEARGVVSRRVKAAKRAQEDAERRKAGAVWWQLEDCPSWCVRTHYAGNGFDERVHDGSFMQWHPADGAVLTAQAGGVPRGDHQLPGDPPYLMVCLRQGTGQARPNVAVQLGSGNWWSVREITAQVARDLGVHLLRLADIAEGIDQ